MAGKGVGRVMRRRGGEGGESDDDDDGLAWARQESQSVSQSGMLRLILKRVRRLFCLFLLTPFLDDFPFFRDEVRRRAPICQARQKCDLRTNPVSAHSPHTERSS